MKLPSGQVPGVWIRGTCSDRPRTYLHKSRRYAHAHSPFAPSPEPLQEALLHGPTHAPAPTVQFLLRAPENGRCRGEVAPSFPHTSTACAGTSPTYVSRQGFAPCVHGGILEPCIPTPHPRSSTATTGRGRSTYATSHDGYATATTRLRTPSYVRSCRPGSAYVPAARTGCRLRSRSGGTRQAWMVRTHHCPTASRATSMRTGRTKVIARTCGTPHPTTCSTVRRPTSCMRWPATICSRHAGVRIHFRGSPCFDVRATW